MCARWGSQRREGWKCYESARTRPDRTCTAATPRRPVSGDTGSSAAPLATWPAWACSASASWGSWPSCPWLSPPIDLGLRGRHVAQGRNDVAPVDLDLLFLASVHQVEVELVDAGASQGPQPLDVVGDRADEAEPVDDLVRDECGVRAPDLGVVEVVVALPLADVLGQLGRQVLARVAVHEVDDVVGHEGREPARPVAAVGKVADMGRRGSH